MASTDPLKCIDELVRPLKKSLDLKKIRKTDEDPPRVSVIDLIAVVNKASNPREAWFGLQRAHPEVDIK